MDSQRQSNWHFNKIAARATSVEGKVDDRDDNDNDFITVSGSNHNMGSGTQCKRLATTLP